MTRRENLFRPIHKGIRSMLCELGLQIGVTDFASVRESNEVVARLEHELSSAASNCILCLLRVHSQHEERDLFSPLRRHDPDVIALMMTEHHEIARRIEALGRTCSELLQTHEGARRIEVGDRLVLESNDLFALYLAHLNNEEATLVPLMWERFTDEELRAMRGRFYNVLPLERFEGWMRWVLPALNLNELEVLVSGMRTDPPPNRYADVVRLCRELLPTERWQQVEPRLGS